MLTVEKLQAFGADVAQGLSRCANNEALYLRLVGLCVEELKADALGDALRAHDWDRAFEAAHKLKGGVSNLALDPLSAPVCELTERLRHKTPGDYDELYGEIKKQADTLAALLD